VQMHPQGRNFVAVSLDESGALRLEALQSSADGGAGEQSEDARPVPPGHFRLLFVHLALGLPAANVTAQDGISMLNLPVGAARSFDHMLTRQQFSVTVSAGYDGRASVVIDPSVLCADAAYAFVLVGTREPQDLYDPVLLRVDGTQSECSLPPDSESADGDISSLVLVNLQPDAMRVVFNWGPSILTMMRRSTALAFGEHFAADALAGPLYVRILDDTPAGTALLPPIEVPVRPQARNVVVALERLPWRNISAVGYGARAVERSLLAIGIEDAPVAANSVRVLLLNALRSDDDSQLSSSAVNDAAHGVASATLRGSATDEVTLLPGETSTYELGSSSAALQVDFSVDTTTSTGTSLELGPYRCSQSLQLVALAGRFGADSSSQFAPSTIHIDSAIQGCKIVSPVLPEATTVAPTTTQPPLTEVNYDITGLGGLSAASRRQGGFAATAWLALAAGVAALLAVQNGNASWRQTGKGILRFHT